MNNEFILIIPFLAILTYPLVFKIEFYVDNISAVSWAVKTIPSQFVYVHRLCLYVLVPIYGDVIGKSACRWHETGDKDHQSGLNQFV